jgi:hypothetical protein
VNDYELRAVFSDGRISPWRNWLPQAPNPAARVEAVIDVLVQKQDRNNQNALVMLLRVLADRVDERDRCHQELVGMAEALERELATQQPQEAGLARTRPMTQQRHIFLCHTPLLPQDERLARYLQDYLDAQGYVVFTDGTTRRNDWFRRAEEEIQQSDLFLVLLSETAADSEMIQALVRRAYDYRRVNGYPRALPVRVAFHDPFPYPLENCLDPHQYLVWRNEDDDERVARDVIAALEARLPDKQPIVPLPGRLGEDGRPTGRLDRMTRPLSAFDPRFLQILGDPESPVGIRDRLYVVRPSDAQLRGQLARSGTTTTIRAPRQTGKSSLLVRGVYLAQQQGHNVAYLDLDQVDQAHRQSGDFFLRYLADYLARLLNVSPESVAHAWGGHLGAQDKLTYWMEEHVLTGQKMLTLALDEVDRLLEAPFRADFFALLRSWHNKRALDERWRRFNLMMAIATEDYLLINEPAQSPFNVGLKLYLQDFTGPQVRDLNQRHGSPVPAAEFGHFMQLFGGHPYLTRMALYKLATERPPWQQFVSVAATDQGPFADHLRHYLFRLSQEPFLRQALQQVIRYNRCTDEMMLFRLFRAGLVKGRGDLCRCRCDLYRLYFQDKLL